MIPAIVAGAVVLSVITITFILYPVFRASAAGRRYFNDSSASDQLADLIAQREAVYEAIRDADFDRETGKLTEEDHQRMRQRLMAEGVRLLQELDRLMQSDMREALEDEIEREVAALRTVPAASRSAEQPSGGAMEAVATFDLDEALSDGRLMVCGSCGGQVREGSKFCTHCGASLEATCPECGALAQPSDQFCGECGARLVPSAHVEEIG